MSFSKTFYPQFSKGSPKENSNSNDLVIGVDLPMKELSMHILKRL